jgi:hypothetical protein
MQLVALYESEPRSSIHDESESSCNCFISSDFVILAKIKVLLALYIQTQLDPRPASFSLTFSLWCSENVFIEQKHLTVPCFQPGIIHTI